jgi:hypothetical protein
LLVILAESKSDAQTIDVLVRRLTSQLTKPKHETFRGKGDLLAQGKRRIEYWAEHGGTSFIICLDADEPTALKTRADAERLIVRPAGIELPVATIVPVQAIEAWILLDLERVRLKCPSFQELVEFINLT